MTKNLESKNKIEYKNKKSDKNNGPNIYKEITENHRQIQKINSPIMNEILQQ